MDRFTVIHLSSNKPFAYHSTVPPDGINLLHSKVHGYLQSSILFRDGSASDAALILKENALTNFNLQQELFLPY